MDASAGRNAADPAIPQLKQSLGLFDVALFFIIACSNLQWVATAAASGPSALTVWLIGGAVMFVPIAVVVVYLSSHYPEEGGMYVWSKRAFGPFSGFMCGWMYWTSNLPYFPALLYFTAGNALFVSSSGSRLVDSAPYFIAVAIAGLALGTLLNVLGLDVGKWLTNVGAASRWLVTLLLIGLGVFAWVRFGPATPMHGAVLRPGLQLKDLIFYSTIAFAWTGPESIPFMAGEVRNAWRTIPLGLAIAAPVVAIIYILGTASVLAALPAASVDPLYGVMQAIAHVASRLQLGYLAPIAAVLVAISCLGSVGAWLGSVARLPFVAGIDRFLPRAFGTMHPRFGSPVASLLTQAAIAAIFILLGQGGTNVKGAYDVLVSMTVLTTMLPFLLLFASAAKLGARPLPGGVRIPGGRLTVIACAALGFATTLFAIVLSSVPSPDDPDKLLAVVKIVGLTLVLILAGVALYAAGKRRQARALEA